MNRLVQAVLGSKKLYHLWIVVQCVLAQQIDYGVAGHHPGQGEVEGEDQE